MNNKHLNKLWFGIFLFTGILCSCQRYDDGPLLSLTSTRDRLENNWTAELISRNSIEETQKFDMYDIHFTKNYTFDWTVKRENDTIEQYWEGKWFFVGDKDRMKLTYLDPTDTLERKYKLDVEILKLKQDEMWIRYHHKRDLYYVRLGSR